MATLTFRVEGMHCASCGMLIDDTLGGPDGAMAAAWNPTDPKQIIGVGMSGGGRSSDGGATWQPIDLPAGVSAVGYDPTGTTVYAGALDREQADVYRSRDGGATWAQTA